MQTRSIVILILTGLVIIVSLQNLQQVSLQLFFWNMEMPLIVLIFFMLIAGFAAGYTIGSFHGSRRAKGKVTRQNISDDAD